MFGVLRFVIQPFFLLWKRQPIKADRRISNKRISKDSGDPCHLLVTKFLSRMGPVLPLGVRLT